CHAADSSRSRDAHSARWAENEAWHWAELRAQGVDFLELRAKRGTRSSSADAPHNELARLRCPRLRCHRGRPPAAPPRDSRPPPSNSASPPGQSRQSPSPTPAPAPPLRVSTRHWPPA